MCVSSVSAEPSKVGFLQKLVTAQKRPSPPLAVNDFSLHGKGTSEKQIRLVKPPFGQRLADARGAHGCAVHKHGLHLRDVRNARAQRVCSGLIPPHAEIVSDKKLAHRQRFLKHMTTKVVGPAGSQLLGERQQKHGVDAELFHGGHLTLAGVFHRAAQQRLMPAMHAVEIADGGRAGSPRPLLAERVRIGSYNHEFTWPPYA